MASRETSGKNVDPGIIQRVVQGIKFAVSGVGPDNWMGPAQPIAPIAQDQIEGRQFDFPVGFNLRQQPRSGEAISFEALRAIADGYDLLRLVIETRKDQIKSYDWEIIPEDPSVSAEDMQDVIDKVQAFMESPDKEHSWDDWIGLVVEDLLVCDGVCIYPRKNKGGELYGFELIDPATIKRVIDDMGRTPLPPDVAYQQIIKGIAAADYSSDMLVYLARNQRTNRIYGFSPVEQVLMTVNIAVRRQLVQMSTYTEGTVPEAIAQVPDTWASKQIKDFQEWWDTTGEGNLGMKKRMRFIPSLKDIVFPKEAVMKDEYDEWLARIICFAFSIPPTAFIKQSNRATAEQADQSAKEEGLKPLLRWLENKLTFLLKRHLGVQGVKFSWKTEEAVDPLVQAQIDTLYITAKVVTPDEVRESLGKDAMTPEEREKAFPTPQTPGFDPKTGAPFAPAANPLDPNPQPTVKTGQPKTGTPPQGTPPNGDKVAQKMVEDLIQMLDPMRVADAVSKINQSRKPDVIEHRPEINVEVGDTNVRNIQERRIGKVFRSKRQADGSIEGSWIDVPATTEEEK